MKSLGLITKPTLWENIEQGLTTVAKGFDYIIHPTHILIDVWNYLVKASGTVFLISALACIILYCLGYKKYGKGITLSFVIYILVQSIGVIVK